MARIQQLEGPDMALHRTAESVLPDSIDSDVPALQRDGIIARKRAFSHEFIEQMREDMMTAFWQAIRRDSSHVTTFPCLLPRRMLPRTPTCLR